MILEANVRANQTALLLAKERYDAQLAPFVDKNPARLAYVKRDLDRLIKECAEEVGADQEWLASRFDSYLATKPKHEDLTYKSDGDSLPPAKDQAASDEPIDDNIVRDDVKNTEPTVTQEEAAKGDAKRESLSKVTAYSAAEAGDLKDETTWKPCFRCDHPLNPVFAQTSPVCADCTRTLLSTKEAFGEAQGDPSQVGLTNPVVDVPFQCAICGQQGTQEELRTHVAQAHADVLQRQQQGVPGQQPAAKKAQGEPEREVAVPPAGTEPTDLFDRMVEDLANRAAARQFSIPTDDEVREIAERYGLDEGAVKNSLVISATFGDYSATNGQIGEEAPEGMDEIDFGGAVDAHEALVPTDMVVQAVASESNTTPDLVYNMVRDRYGADLDEKYHASVSGDHRFFLPAGMAAEPAPEPQYDEEVGPTAQPTAV
jgi:hypothetical protein